MKTMTLSAHTDLSKTVKVWDPLVRVFHWSLVLAFFGAYLLGDDGGQLHQTLGYTVLGLVAFRLIWGLIGGRHARFINFVPSYRTTKDYLKDVAVHREARYLGHNPAGAVMIVALLLALIGTGTSGWLMTTDTFWDSKWMEEVHEILANGTLLLVGLHVAGVVFSSWRHHENLVRSMFTGRKRSE